MRSILEDFPELTEQDILACLEFAAAIRTSFSCNGKCFLKLLFDQNLSRRLVVRLADIFPGASHVQSLARFVVSAKALSGDSCDRPILKMLHQ